MKRLDNKLKLSVSLLALMSGGAIIAAPAQAVTISGAQNSVVITTDISDLTVDSTGDVSPGGILVQGAVAGAVVNDGSVKFNDTPTAGDSDAVDADAVAFEVQGDIGGDFSNTGTFAAVADASVSVIGDFSGDADINQYAPSSAEADASGVWLQGVKNVNNTGDITATSTADASSDITAVSKGASHVDGGSYSRASSYGFEGDVSVDFTNAKDATITADASASSDVIADVGGTSAVLFDVDAVAAEGYASGVYLDDVKTVNNAGTISAVSDATAVLDGTATATDGDAIIGGEGVGLYATSQSNGLTVYGEDAVSITNSGPVTADAKASATGTLTADATKGEGMISEESNVYSYASGIDAYTALDSFTNSGAVTATASSALSLNAIATGDEGASVGLDNEVRSESYGIYLEDLDGPFSNSAAITSTSTADLKVIADAGSDAVTDGAIETGNYVQADAWGVQVENFDGTFTNSKDGKIAASATATSSIDLSSTGASADSDGFAGSESYTVANAIGVSITGGEGVVDDPDTNLVTNDGTISATASATSTSVLSGTTTGTGATGGAEQYDVTGALAVGLLDMGDADGFTNTGTITAASTASHTGTLTGDGDVDSGAGTQGTLYSAAVGAGFLGPVDGNINNSGTIGATASGVYDIDIVSDNKTDLGSIGSSNFAGVAAIGLAADIEGVSGEDDVASTFTNSGTISAKGDLKVDITQPAASKAVTPEQDTLGGLVVAGAFVSGDPSVVTNSGTISAIGSLNSTGVSGEDSTTAAGVVGLWLPDANEGLVVNNSGKLTAELSGNAEHSASVGLLLGPLPDGLLDGILGEDSLPISLPLDVVSEADVLATGVITVNNTGTISGTNSTEGGFGYGIYAETAPVPVVINQQGGLITGTTAAIAMDQGNADVLNWSGGSIVGLVDADSADVVNIVQATKDGKGIDTSVTAGTDFELEGAGQLNIGSKGAPVTFVMNGKVSNVGEGNLNSVSTLVVGPTGTIQTDTFNQADGSTLIIQFNPTQAGLITTTGDYNADGNLQTQALPGLYGDKGSHIVIDAGGVVAGKFDTVGTIGDTLLIDFTTTVNPSDVTVSWERNAFNEVDGLSDNSKSVAGAIADGYDPTRPASKNAIELNDQLGGLFTLTDPVLYDRVLNSWSGSEHAQVMRAATNLSEPYLMALGEHLNDNRNVGFKQQNVVQLLPKGSTSIAPASSVGQSGAEDGRISFWGRGFGRWASTRGDANAGGYDEDTYGAVLGMDFSLSPTFLIGVVGSYIDDNIDFDDGDLGGIKRWSIGGYASASFDAFYVDGSFTYASDNYKVNRTILTGGTACLTYACTAGVASKYNGDGLIGHAEAGFNWLLGDGGARLQPFAGLNYTNIDTDPFTETGGGDLGLNVLDGTGKSLQSRLGARLSGEWGSGNVKWVPELRGEWRHEFKDNPAWIQASLVGLPNQPFTTVGSEVSRDMAVVGAGLTAQFQSGWGLFIDYQGAFASGYHSHIAQGGVRVKF